MGYGYMNAGLDDLFWALMGRVNPGFGVFLNIFA
jgi:hypothetical protein